MQVGELTIEPVLDGTVALPVTHEYTYPRIAAERWAPYADYLDEGRVVIDMGGYLVRSGDRIVLVDAGAGVNSSPFTGGRFLESLAALGVGPLDVTDVVFTHLHFDHVGWATRRGEVVFPNATYRCHRADWDHFVPADPGTTRKLAPIEPRLELFDTDGPLAPGLHAVHTPGHTPGSTVVVLSSGGARAMLLGDVVHCPVELVDEEWEGMSDVDPQLARQARTALARELEASGTPAAAAHFPGLRFGRLLAGDGERPRRWVV
jgi:glyoxylase-like metal-dependent hydrolase (beta-lactamase superfamily II)